MDDFSINEMLEMQQALQEKYKDIWKGISPEVGKNKLLWMIGEIGEVRVNGKQLKVNAEYLKECREAHKVFAIFNLSINNAWEGEDRLATIASSKVSSEFAEEFLETYDGMLKKLMTTERLEQILL